MREALNQMDFVLAAYAIGIIGTLVVVSWSWLAMQRAEARRDRIKRR